MSGPRESLDSLFEEIKGYPTLKTEEVNELVEKIKEGDIEARNVLVEHNIKFVVTVAKRYSYGPIPFEDLVQEGCDGLITAAEKFDPSFGVKFISFAVYHIRQRILLALSQQRSVIRQPPNAIEAGLKVKKFREKFKQEHGHEPTVEKVAEAVGETKDMVSLVFFGLSVASLDEPIHRSEGGVEVTRYSLFSDAGFNPEEDLICKEDEGELHRQKSLVLKIIKNLEGENERNKEIFIQRFCLDGSLKQPDLKELGAKHGIVRERVRQIVDRMFRKITRAIALEEKRQSLPLSSEFRLDFRKQKRRE
jgi:RNA polymerase primary sigma factor